MTGKPEKPEPAGRTANTPFRLTDEDKRRLDAIQDYHALWDRIDVLRFLMDKELKEIEGRPRPEKKTRTKYRRPT